MKRLLLFAVLIAGCGIPKEKYESTLDELKKANEAGTACSTERDDLKKKNADMTKQLSDLGVDLDAEKKRLEGTEKSLGEANKTMTATQKELDELRKQHAMVQKRLEAFQKLTARFQKMIASGKISVAIRHGQMVMKLPAGILFASGKADLSKDGEVAITEVAAILKEFSDRRFLITGHTDDRPLGRGDRFKDNWELSAGRAVTVTKFLVAQGVPSVSVAAAGYGEFDPVGDNKTDEGRQQNRRIEIVLLPNLEELGEIKDTN